MDLRRWDENIEEIVIDKGKKKKKTVLSDAQIAKVKVIGRAQIPASMQMCRNYTNPPLWKGKTVFVPTATRCSEQIYRVY